jgi:hypothetical protein
MEDKTYIPGIYNYCDHWCEKCSYTSNCYLFASESKIAAHQILNNGEMPDFEDYFNDELSSNDEDDDNFYESDEQEDWEAELNSEDEEEVNLSETDSSSDCEPDCEPDKTYLEELSYNYLTCAHSFLDKLYEKYPFLGSRSDAKIQDEFKGIYLNTEIINWYHTFQYPKFRRAVAGKNEVDGEKDDFMKEFAADDMNGSAKIAIIAITRSIESLNYLYSYLPEFGHDIPELLIISGELLNEAEKEFPDYKSFKRPGLDN